MTPDDVFRPPGPDLGAVTPPPGGADDALRRIHGIRRRRGAAGGIVAAVTLLLAAAVAVVPADRPGDRVVVVSPPPGPGDPRDPDATPSSTTSTTAAETGGAPAGDGVRPGATTTTTSRPSGTGPSTESGGSPDRAPAERTREGSVGIECSVPTAPEWCTSTGAGDSGTRYPQLFGRICRANRPGVLTFATEQEIEFVVYDSQSGGDELWRWSSGQRFPPSAHELDVDANSCFLWSVVWDGTDDAGRDLPDGDYWFEVVSVAEEIDGPLGSGRTSVAVAGSP